MHRKFDNIHYDNIQNSFHLKCRLLARKKNVFRNIYIRNLPFISLSVRLSPSLIVCLVVSLSISLFVNCFTPMDSLSLFCLLSGSMLKLAFFEKYHTDPFDLTKNGFWIRILKKRTLWIRNHGD